MSLSRIMLGFSLAAFTAFAAAQDRRPDYGPAVNTATAKKIAAGVLAECQKNGWNVAVAVVDTHGFLVYFERMENTQYASNDIAINKAKTAATHRRPTRAFMMSSTKAARPLLRSVMDLPPRLAICRSWWTAR